MTFSVALRELRFGVFRFHFGFKTPGTTARAHSRGRGAFANSETPGCNQRTRLVRRRRKSIKTN